MKNTTNKCIYKYVICIVKPTRCTRFSNLFYSGIKLHVSERSFVHHQEFKTVHTATGIRQTDSADCLLAGKIWKAVT
jgi:hypothetical protein